MSRVFDGNVANYLSFTGTLGLTDPFTILFYVKKAATPVAGETFYAYNNAASKFFRARTSAGGVALESINSQTFGGNASLVTALPIGTWEPILVTISAGTAFIESQTEAVSGGFLGTIIADSSPVFYIGSADGSAEPATGKIAQVTIWSSVLSVGDVALIHAGNDPSSVSTGTLVEHWPLDTASLIGTVGSKTLVVSGTVATDADNPIVAGPTLTGPDTTTVDAVRVAAGTDLDTATTAGLKVESSYSLSLTIDAQTATTLTQTDDIGTPTLGNPVDSLPVTADTLAAGTTVWQIQQWVDDGTNPEVQRNITLAGVAGTKTVQYLTTGDDAANTTIGESFVGTDIIAVEDNMTMTYQEITDTVTVTVNANGTFTTDKDQTITFDLRFWSPSTGEASLATVTILGSAILSTSGITRALTRTLTRSLTRQV